MSRAAESREFSGILSPGPERLPGLEKKFLTVIGQADTPSALVEYGDHILELLYGHDVSFLHLVELQDRKDIDAEAFQPVFDKKGFIRPVRAAVSLREEIRAVTAFPEPGAEADRIGENAAVGPSSHGIRLRIITGDGPVG